MLLYFGPKAGLGLIKSQIYPPPLSRAWGVIPIPPPHLPTLMSGGRYPLEIF